MINSNLNNNRCSKDFNAYHPINSILLNSEFTSFSFRINDSNISKLELEKSYSANEGYISFEQIIELVKKDRHSILFDQVVNPIFKNNLILLDGNMAEIIAHLLIEQLYTGISSISRLISLVSVSYPFTTPYIDDEAFYTYKLKQLLSALIHGMLPQVSWDTKYDSSKSLLVRKENGRTLCFHCNERNSFEDYLFANSYLERSSTSRHQYA